MARVSLTEFCWYNEATNAGCPGPYNVDFIQQNTFTFLLIRNNNVLANISSFSVSLPDDFCFTVPEEHLAFNPIYLRIYLEGVLLTTEDIPVPVDDVIPTLAANSIVIIASTTGAILVLVSLIFLLVVVVLCCLSH